MVNADQFPVVTFALFSYNQERFIRQAVQGALGQDYFPLEIIISDDCSTDSTFDIIIEEISKYRGDHKIVLNRNDKNMGVASHVNLVMDMSGGEIVVLGAGDDISIPSRVATSVRVLNDHPEASFVSLASIDINGLGEVIGGSKRALRPRALRRVDLSEYMSGASAPLSGATRALRRDIYRVFGPFNEKCPTEDTPTILRALMMGPVYSCDEVGIYYRRHRGNLSSSASLGRMSLDEIRNQYISDADRALDFGIVSKDLYLSIIEWIDLYIRRRYLNVEFIQSSNKMRFVINHILYSRDFNTKDKVSYLKKALLGWKTNF